jgi:hypothetical protein
VPPKQTTPSATWLLYAIRTPDCAALDPRAYPKGVYHEGPIPWPSWACGAPDGGIHKDNRIGRIDVHLAAGPKKKDQISWTCEFQVTLVARAWLRQIEDLIDPAKTSVGQVFLHGQELTDWTTLHEATPPLVMMKDGWRRACPICGEDNNVIYRGMFFADPAVLGRSVIVTGEGVFIRKDEAMARGLAPPAGGFKPVAVPYRPEWVAQMRLRTPPNF